MLAGIINRHPSILSVSEIFATMGVRSLRPRYLTGRKFWKRLSTPSTMAGKVGNPDTAPNEFLYHKVANRRFDPYRVPPILAITLPHLTLDPDKLFDELASVVPSWGRASIGTQYERLFAELRRHCGGDFWVERSGGTLSSVGILREEFPEARYVYLYRDGRDVAMSIRDFFPMKFGIRIAKWHERRGRDPFSEDNRVGRSLLLELLEPIYARIIPWEEIYAEEMALDDAGWLWANSTLAAMPTLRSIPREDLLCLRYEDIIADPARQLAALERYLGATPDAAWLERVARIPKNRPPNWMALPDDARTRISEMTREAREASEAFLADALTPNRL